VIWSPVAGRNFDSFAWRLNAQYPLLDRLKVNYRKPDAESTRREPEKK
jgi:N-acetyl-beta-hexosaminidase